MFSLDFRPSFESASEPCDVVLYNRCDGFHIAEAKFEGAEFLGFFPFIGDAYPQSFFDAWARLPDPNRDLRPLFVG